MEITIYSFIMCFIRYSYLFSMTVLSHILLIVKYFIYLVFEDIIWLHLGIISLSVILLVCIKKIKNLKSPTLTVIRPIDYKIETLGDLYYSISILVLYFAATLGCVFLLRIWTIGKDVDLRVIYNSLLSFIATHSFLHLFIYLISIICLVIWYLIGIKSFKTFTFFHINRLHILWCYQDKDYPYDRMVWFFINNCTFISDYLSDFVKNHLIKKMFPAGITIKNSFYLDYCNKTIWFFMIIEKYLALIITAISVLFDMILNDMTLHHVYYIFPFAILYASYQNICNFFVDRMYVDYDHTFYRMIYEENFHKTLLPNEFSTVNIGIAHYIKNNFKRL